MPSISSSSSGMSLSVIYEERIPCQHMQASTVISHQCVLIALCFGGRNGQSCSCRAKKLVQHLLFLKRVRSSRTCVPPASTVWKNTFPEGPLSLFTASGSNCASCSCCSASNLRFHSANVWTVTGVPWALISASLRSSASCLRFSSSSSSISK